MKKLFQNSMLWMAVIMLSLSAVSCEKDNNGDDPNEDELLQSILDKYVTTTVIPTYKALAEGALEMRAANEALKISQTDANMKAASDAWMKTRIVWELSEAFLFGPVSDDAMDIDAHIDSWPLELNDIKEVLANGALELTGKKAWLMDAEVIGFHVTEYLLYRDGQSRPAADLTAAELKYLTAATDALVWDCILAYVAWVGEDNVTAEMKSVFRENDDIVKHLTEKNAAYMNFGQKLKNGTNYSSMKDAFDEIAGGCADIAGEVGTTKIEGPYQSGKVEDVESWYSWHSLDDYTNNIYSIKNAYLGGLGDGSRTSVSLSTYVASKDANLDTKIKEKIDECITKIGAMGKGGKSFYEVVRDQINKTEVEAAVDACVDLENLFKGLPEL